MIAYRHTVLEMVSYSKDKYSSIHGTLSMVSHSKFMLSPVYIRRRTSTVTTEFVAI